MAVMKIYNMHGLRYFMHQILIVFHMIVSGLYNSKDEQKQYKKKVQNHIFIQSV